MKGFSVYLGESGKGFVENYSKAVPEVLGMKYRSEFKHGFTNRACLHCAVLKALYEFQKKRAHKSRIHLQNVQNEIFKMFKTT